jgi:hypothetical protein
MTTCAAVECVSTDTRQYLNGHVCSDHTPARAAGRSEPVEHDASWIGQSWQTPAGAVGGSDINKTRTGGYTSRQKAKKIAQQRDAVREASTNEAADIIFQIAIKQQRFSINDCRPAFDRAGIKETARGPAFGAAKRRKWIEFADTAESTGESAKGARVQIYTSLIYGSSND